VGTSFDISVKLLQPLGFSLQEASNGREAIALWQSWHPQLIWMDMRMPVLDGYQATQAIKQSIRGQATAIIALTASVLEEEKTLILDAGCDDFLKKPFREEEIFTLLATHLGVEYIYENNNPNFTNFLELDDNIKKECFEHLPLNWCIYFHKAILYADLATARQLLVEISPSHSLASKLLENLIDDYQYEKILHLISQRLPNHDRGDAQSEHSGS
jgi:Amt family ammonium transporter